MKSLIAVPCEDEPTQHCGRSDTVSQGEGMGPTQGTCRRPLRRHSSANFQLLLQPDGSTCLTSWSKTQCGAKRSPRVWARQGERGKVTVPFPPCQASFGISQGKAKKFQRLKTRSDS